MKIIKCPSCNAMISPLQEFCPRCGAKLSKEQEENMPKKKDTDKASQDQKDPVTVSGDEGLSTGSLASLTSVVLVIVCVAAKVVAYMHGAGIPSASSDPFWMKVDFFFSVFLVFALIPLPFGMKKWWGKALGLLIVLALGTLWIIHCIRLYNNALWIVDLF